MHFRSIICLLAVTVGLLGACETTSDGPAPDGLAGTAWQLVKIMSMDDSVHVPDDPSAYTLALQVDGSAAIRAGCNRGAGSWRSESKNHLKFTPIAATRALCPPGSLSEQYLAQFAWVRSYVLKGGHLFLATKADGAIIEFAPSTAEQRN